MQPKKSARSLALKGFKPIAVQQREARLNAVIRRGLEFHQLGNIVAARELYASVLQESPKHFDALHLLGVICSQTGEPETGIRLLTEALEINKHHAVAHNNLGNAYAQLANWHAAVRNYEKAIHLDPLYSLAFFNRGIAHEELGQIHAALSSYRRAIQIDFKNTKAHSNYGALLDKIGSFNEALEHFDKAIALEPQFAGAYYNRATHHMKRKHYDKALKDFNKAIEIQPDFADAYWNSSLTHLSKGNWAAGWDMYHWRWLRSELGPQEFRPPIETNRLALALIDSKKLKVCLWNEQGIGDVIFHASMFSNAVARFGSLTVQTDRRLIPLLQRSIKGAVFVDMSAPIDEKSFDLHLAHGDLGYFFRRSSDDFQRIKPRYLEPDSDYVKALRSGLYRNGKLLCGIAWRSSNVLMGTSKSVGLQKLLPLFQIEDIHFVNLQYGDTSDDLREFESAYGFKIATCSTVDNFSDIDGHAALVDACDLIVTVSNSTAHIAGALGKQTHVLLPQGGSRLWYWANRFGNQNLWYPTVQVHEQSESGDWDVAVSKIAELIKENTRVSDRK